MRLVEHRRRIPGRCVYCQQRWEARYTNCRSCARCSARLRKRRFRAKAAAA